ncbi:MAG TPA: PadR family transcriptional regulator [Methanocella sp.]|nr:PadR family transcriptional regulator [Methanocella sp.]
MHKINYARYIVLGMLSCGPTTGYEVKRFVKEFMSYIWDISYGQIYPTLSLLERQGCATMNEEKTGGGRPKKVYQITDQGLTELQAWLRGPETKEYELFLKLCFGSLLTPDELIPKLEAYRRKREEELPIMEEWLKTMESGPVMGPNTPYYLLLTKFGFDYFHLEKEWCSQSIETLKKLE